VSEEGQAGRVIQALLERCGRLGRVVKNNGPQSPAMGLLLRMKTADCEAVIDLNLTGSFSLPTRGCEAASCSRPAAAASSTSPRWSA